jgi:hypothetical protein
MPCWIRVWCSQSCGADSPVRLSVETLLATSRVAMMRGGGGFPPRKFFRTLCYRQMPSKQKNCTPTFSFRDLTVWRTKLPGVQFAVLPPSNNRPNPLATEDHIYASVFAPGAICALERDRGKLIWRRELKKYGGASPYLNGGRLFAKSSNTLFALQPDSGETLWSFCPYGTDGESIYSSPSADKNRVYIGDRKGFLHCLDAESGKTIWKRQTNRAGSDVNSTPVLSDGLVTVSTNAKAVVAYDALSGKLAWKQKLDGPSTFGPLIHGNSILAVSNSLYLLSPTGKVQRRFSWKNQRVDHVESTPRGIAVTFWPEWVVRGAELPSISEPVKLTLIVTKSGVQRTAMLTPFSQSFRYVRASRLLCVSHSSGIDLIYPSKGTLLCRIKTSKDPRNGAALVDVRDKKIYVLTGDGCVHALRHPLNNQL